MQRCRSNPYLFFGLWISGVGLFITLLSYQYFNISIVASYGIGVSAAGFILMGLDKSLAVSGSMRAPEKILFALAALGGGPGILLGMHVFRHKTRKVAFQCILMLICMVQFFAASKLGIQFRNPPVHDSAQ